MSVSCVVLHNRHLSADAGRRPVSAAGHHARPIGGGLTNSPICPRAHEPCLDMAAAAAAAHVPQAALAARWLKSGSDADRSYAPPTHGIPPHHRPQASLRRHTRAWAPRRYHSIAQLRLIDGDRRN
eukprot:scaffold12612_cov112-Isochrysis_galbana.AAC.2